MEYVTLNNGIKMPKLGYGVYQTPPEDTKHCALEPLTSATAASTPLRPITTRTASARRWLNRACPGRSSF